MQALGEYQWLDLLFVVAGTAIDIPGTRASVSLNSRMKKGLQAGVLLLLTGCWLITRDLFADAVSASEKVTHAVRN